MFFFSFFLNLTIIKYIKFFPRLEYITKKFLKQMKEKTKSFANFNIMFGTNL